MQFIKIRTNLAKSPKVQTMARWLLTQEEFGEWLIGSPAVYTEITDLIGRHEIVTLRAVTRIVVSALADVWDIARGLGTRSASDLVLPMTEIRHVDLMADIPRFGDAMALAGWLGFDSDAHAVIFPNFFEHNGSKTDAERSKDYRARKRDASSRTVTGRHVTVENDPSQSSRLEEKRREEKREEEKENKAKEKAGVRPQSFDPSKVEIPPELRGTMFAHAWARWCRHRSEIRKRLTPTSVKQQLAKLEAMGLARAIAAIDHTIAQGWMGIRESDTSKAKPAKFSMAEEIRRENAERAAAESEPINGKPGELLDALRDAHDVQRSEERGLEF